MEWFNFNVKQPKVRERILVVREWVDYDFELNKPKRCWALYECNFEGIKRDIRRGTERTIINLANLKYIAGEKFFNFFQNQYFVERTLHWARIK